MRLVRLELFGFKSFADSTVLEFGQRSLTGVVGPNGCGKSNVVDAVRWALGETRPSSMRGSGMTDVIFKGSVSRPAMGFAEVTLVFDNSDGELPDHSAEVSVTRRLEASGEGSYLIDGQRVRLKDVKDLLFDTGLGSRGYSVLEQGRIDAVLSANPQQRRAVFEEAAGISRYRQRRHETELRLKHVAADMERVDDVIAELRSRVRSLKIQAGKAERFLVARDEWSTGRRRFLGHRLFNIDGELHGLEPEIASLSEALEEQRQRRQAHEAEAQRREEERSQVVLELDRVSGESGRLEGEARALEERRKALLARVENWRHSADEEGTRADQLEQELKDQNANVEALALKTEALTKQAATAKISLEEFAGHNRTCNQRYRDSRQATEAQNETVLARLHDRGAAASRSRQLAEHKPRLEERVERVNKRHAELEESLAQGRAEQGQVEQAVQVAESEAQEAANLRGEQQAQLEGRQEVLRNMDVRRAALDLERAGHQARVDALRDRERQLEELDQGSLRLLEAVSEDGSREDGANAQAPCADEDLLGVVADHLTIDTRLARSLDAILGSRASALVVRDAHVARGILEWAQAEEHGGLSLVVPPGLGAPPCPTPTDFALFAQFGNGVEGRLCDLVRCDDQVRPLARALLCDVVVVSDLDVGLKLVSKNPEWRFVTPLGEVVDAAGLSGGFLEMDQGAVGRRAASEEFEHRCEVLAKSLLTLDEERQREIDGLLLDGEALRVGEARREAALDALAEATRTRAALQGRLEEQAAAFQEHEAERTRVSAEQIQLEEDLQQAGKDHLDAEQAVEVENERLASLDRERHELEQERDGIQRETAAADVERQRVDSERQACDERLRGDRMRIERDEGELARALRRSENFLANALSGEGEADVVRQQEVEHREQAQALVGQLEGLRKREREGAALAQEARQAAEAVQVELDQASEQLNQQKLTQQRLELERQELLGRAQEELSLTRDDLKLGFEAESDLATAGAMQSLSMKVAELKRVLDKLGPVNLDAVHELDEVSERLDNLETQARDLSDARKNLEETIKRIDEESRRMFLETFTEVREHFRVIFRQLFGGGRADLQLDPDQDILEAGIEIIARPPGREMLPIGLLSGGQRTMTALALLFAVFKSKPSPFCILDEVDAALDDANIDRFLAMLAGFRDTSQFVVVTHNKGTMSACEALFGVTMQTKGVSRFVAVELSQVDDIAPESMGKVREGSPDLIGRGDLNVQEDAEERDFDEHGDPVVELQPAPRPTGGEAAAEESGEPPGDAGQEETAISSQETS
jgi:chromosome segregation protein